MSRGTRRILIPLLGTFLGSDIVPFVNFIRMNHLPISYPPSPEMVVVFFIPLFALPILVILVALEVTTTQYGTSGLERIWREIGLVIVLILTVAYLSWMLDPLLMHINPNRAIRLLLALILIGGLVMGLRHLWNQEPARIFLLIYIVRTIPLIVFATLMGLLTTIACTFTGEQLGFFQPAPDTMLLWLCGGWIFTSIIACSLCLWRRAQIQMSATLCHRVLQRIEQHAVNGVYEFPRGAVASNVLREGRILQYLGRLQQPISARFPTVRSQLGRYELVPQESTQSDSSLGPANSRADTQKDMSFLIEKANEIWIAGAKQGWWRARGANMPIPPYRLFGSELDKLFNNGNGFNFHGAEGPRIVTMVIKGQPGAGKSTLALQSCVTLAQQGFTCVYYSLEEEREGLLQSVRDFGWLPEQISQDTAYATSKQEASSVHPKYAGVHYGELERGQSTRDASNSHRKKSGVDGSPVGNVFVSSLGYRAMSVTARTRHLRQEWGAISGELPRCVVIDSLEGFANVGLEDGGKDTVPRDQLLKLKDFFRDRCELLIILVEDDGSGRPGYVDFVADVVIQLGRRLEEDYTILYAEILKARNQTHALGKHQIKIRSSQDNDRLRRSASAFEESATISGVQLFPSLHFRLSQAAKNQTFDQRFMSSGLSELDMMLDAYSSTRGGLRRQTSNVLVGPPGTGKTVIAMNFLLEGVRENTATLLISLHDEPNTIMRHPPPQEDGRIIFEWVTDDLKQADGVQNAYSTNGNVYHSFRWSIEGITKWVEEKGRPRRLPYLFEEGPVSYQTSLSDDRYREQGESLSTFLRSLVEEASKHSSWDDAAARSQMEEAHASAWQIFEQRWQRSLRKISATEYKKLELEWDKHSNKPGLRWDSRHWRDGTDGQGQLLYDTSLLQIMYQRPGNVTPEEFIERLSRLIGQPDDISKFERVVVDDVAQIPLRLPLLAKSKLFLPTLLDILRAEGITTLFLQDNRLQVDGLDGPDLALEIMADHVIHTEIRPRKSPAGQSDDELHEPRVIVRTDASPGMPWQPPRELTISSDRYVKLEILSNSPPAADDRGQLQDS